jgi:hypothetical protein
MIRRGRRPAVDPAASVKYQRVGASLMKGARDLEALAAEGDSYGNAIAVIAIHAAIAYTDALSVRFGGFKSAEGDHVRVVDALKEALGKRADETAIRHLRRVLAEKDQVAYQGEYYTIADARRLTAATEKFATWAEDLLRFSPAP